MFFFEGSKCPCCGEELKAGEDVIACPVCGAPHHRDCYNNNGGCAFEARHEEGYVWQREPVVETASVQTEIRRCPSCSAENSAERLWCEKCGAPMNSQSPGTEGFAQDSEYSSREGASGFYSFGGENTIADNELIDDVPAGDLRRFMKGQAYYIPLFATFVRLGKKVSLSMLGFLFHGLWFLSHKMYLLGGVVLAVQTALNAFMDYCYVELDDLIDLYENGTTSEVYGMIAELMVERPLLIYGMLLATFLRYAVLFGSGLLGNWLYKEHCVRTVKKLNARAKSAEEFNNLLDAKGGSALPLAFGVGVLYIAVRMFLQSIITG